MTKAEFTQEILRRTGHLSRAEVDKWISFYSECVDDRMEEGMDEAEAVAGLGNMEDILKSMEQETPGAAGYQGDLTVTTKNGTIHLQGISAAHCLAQSANGSLELKNLALQSLSAGTDNGGIRLAGITAGSVEAETANGSIWLETLTADTVTVSSKRGGLQIADVDAAVLQGETALGEVSFEKLRISQRLELSSHAGNVSGSLYGEQQDFTISARTSLGNCDLPQQTTGGACSLRLPTDLGNISVRFLGK